MRDMMRFSKVLLATTALVAVGSLALRAQAQTLPSGGSVASGQVAIGAPNAGRMAITQGSQNAIVNWQGFSIGQGGRVDITQPNSSAAMLNRVTGQAPSTIAGQLNANGRVYLVNPNGIAITNSGVVNTGSFVASTLGISDSDFLSGRLRFQGNGASAAVSNAGRIQAGPGGYAALLGGTVDNSGTISVPLGRIGLGSGERVTLDLSGDGFLQVAVPTAAGGDQALVSNSGRLSAPGGRVEIAAATAQSAARHAINMSGVVEANAVSGRAGSISFSGGPGGAVNVSGRVDASSATGRGGNVTVTGARIALRGAEVNASGATGGGRVRIGGDRQGQGDLPRAQQVSVDNASVIRADATRRGDGGDIVLWSEGRTDFAGRISARGGAEGGRGGEAEVSSRGVLNYTGWTDLRAPLGAWGTLLLDPYNITISNGVQTTGAGFTATTDNSVINAGTLVTALGGANVVVSTGLTGSAGTQAGNITLEVPLTWSGASNLTLQAAGEIGLNGAVTASAGGLTLQAGGNISATGAISVARFELASGNWVQNTAALPGFAAADFRITGGSFLRAAGGAGTGLDPYRLTDIYGVQGMGSSSALRAASYQLANDIAAAGTSGWNGGAGFVPVGTDLAPFTGSLNGAGYVINGLTIDRPTMDNVGLIGFSGSISGISNLGLVGGSVTGGAAVGGLVGVNFGSITQSHATGAVTGAVAESPSVGGLVGINDGGSITQSYATGAVTGSAYGMFVGGLVGTNLGGSIMQSYATGAVTGSAGSTYVGGLVGFNILGGSITQSYATGAVTGSANGAFVGGLVGENSGGSITQSYATGAVTGDVYVGGLVGTNNFGSSITQSYATGAVTGGFFFGGLVGGNVGTVQTSFWFKPADGTRNSLDNGFGTGLNATAMRNPASFTGWDLSSTWNLENAPRPFLRYWQQSLTATVANVTTTYNANDYAGTPGINYSVSGFVPETAPVFNYNGGAAPRDAGTYTITACCLSSTQQYAATAVVPGTLTINPASLTLSGGRTYNGETAAAGATLTANGVNGESFALTGAGVAASKNVGTAALSGLGDLALGTGANGALSSNYTALSHTGSSYSITPASLTITGGTTTATYTATAQTNTSALTTAGLLGSDSVTGVSGRASGTNVGTYNDALTAATGTGLGNYNISYVNGGLTINPAALTITGGTTNSTYTAAAQTNTFTPSGLLGSDSVSGVSGRATSTNWGTYNDALTAATGTGLGNYNISYVNGALAINRRPITVTADDLARGNGMANPALTYRITNSSLVGGDNFTGNLSTNARQQSPAGSYEISQGSLLLISNYALTFVPGTLTVRPTAMISTGSSASVTAQASHSPFNYQQTPSGETDEDEVFTPVGGNIGRNQL